MKILSIDVGIKNLAYCLIETLAEKNTSNISNNYKILKWDVINLCGKEPVCTVCQKTAKYTGQKINDPQNSISTSSSNARVYFCVTHAKKSAFKMPEPTLALKKVKVMKLVHLNELVKEFNIVIPATQTKKEDILKNVLQYLSNEMLSTTTAVSANSMDLVSLGIAMQKSFDVELKEELESIDHIIIENQISPIANRMKTLQGMLAQYFIMRNKTKIVFVSSANKLKGYDLEEEPDATVLEEPTNANANANASTTYGQRKKAGVKITLNLLNENNYLTSWIPHFKTHKKKDDLADAFLQGKWYLTTRM